jgi:hypothetical protein
MKLGLSPCKEKTDLVHFRKMYKVEYSDGERNVGGGGTYVAVEKYIRGRVSK